MTDLKTTTAGVLFAVWIVAEPIIKTGDFDFKRDWTTLIIAIIGGAIGYFAKDSTKVEDSGFLGIISPKPRQKR